MLTKKVFKDLAIYMIGFGVVMGIVFPFFVLWVTDVPARLIINPVFFFLCITAGFLVGLFNIFLARKIVGSKLRLLSGQMKYVENRLSEKAKGQGGDSCADERCFIQMESEDEIGDCAKAFNALVKALSRAFSSEESVRNFTQLLSSRLELQQLAEEALSKLMENLHAAGGAIVIEREGELSILSSYGIQSPETILQSHMVWEGFRQQKRVLLTIPEDIMLNNVLLDFRPKSVLMEPILYKGVVLGIIVLATIENFSIDMQNDLGLYGQGLALAFKNAITHDQLQKLAANDPLTGVYNRRFGLARLKEEFIRAVKTEQPIGVIMLDVDHFKKINDAYGHLVGDKLLVLVTKTMKKALREGDVTLRYGGEEFVVILPGASLQDVKQIAERVRRYVEDTELRQGSQIVKTTVSIGGTSFPEHNAEQFMDLVNLSDTLLYQAKERGRNTVITE